MTYSELMDSYKTRSLERAKRDIKDNLVKSNYTSDDIYESAINFFENYSHKLNRNIFVKIHLSVIYSIYKYLDGQYRDKIKRCGNKKKLRIIADNMFDEIRHIITKKIQSIENKQHKILVVKYRRKICDRNLFKLV